MLSSLNMLEDLGGIVLVDARAQILRFLNDGIQPPLQCFHRRRMALMILRELLNLITRHVEKRRDPVLPELFARYVSVFQRRLREGQFPFQKIEVFNLDLVITNVELAGIRNSASLGRL